MTRPRPFYFLGRALRNLWAAPLPALLTAATIAVALFLFGALLVTGENLRRALVGSAEASEHVSVYLDVGAEPAVVDRVRGEVASLDQVREVVVVAPEVGLEDLLRTLGEDARVLDGVDAGATLPTVLSISLRDPLVGIDGLSELSQTIEALPGVESVDSGRLWIEQYSELRTVGQLVLVGWGWLLGLGALLVISSSARLAAFTRQQEIEVLRLVGASDSFVLVPFALEGAIQGMVGSALAVGGLLVAYVVMGNLLAGFVGVVPLLANLEFLDRTATLMLLGSGPFLGSLGSVMAARRFLREVPL